MPLTDYCGVAVLVFPFTEYSVVTVNLSSCPCIHFLGICTLRSACTLRMIAIQRQSGYLGEEDRCRCTYLKTDLYQQTDLCLQTELCLQAQLYLQTELHQQTELYLQTQLCLQPELYPDMHLISHLVCLIRLIHVLCIIPSFLNTKTQMCKVTTLCVRAC
jgi:hypothetical protein